MAIVMMTATPAGILGASRSGLLFAVLDAIFEWVCGTAKIRQYLDEAPKLERLEARGARIFVIRKNTIIDVKEIFKVRLVLGMRICNTKPDYSKKYFLTPKTTTPVRNVTTAGTSSRR